jgi:predicted amidohydrolase YtcJ
VATVILGAEVEGRPGLDVRVERGRIVHVGRPVPGKMGDRVVDAAGGALIPGLHDHHLHLRSLAASLASVPVGPPEVTDAGGLAARLRAVARRTPPGGWIRGVGYHQSVAGHLDRHGLDAVVAGQPVRVQHRSGSLWILNSAAVRVTGLERCQLPGVERDAAGRPSGRLWRMDEWLRTAVPAVAVDFGAVSRQAAAEGVTGLTDATPSACPRDAGALLDAVGRGEVVQRVHLMSGHWTRPPAGERITEGPFKVVLHDDDLAGTGQLAATVGRAHGKGRPVAVHCVTRAQLLFALVALGEAGALPGDRIEHGAVIPPELFGELRRLGVTVVTQLNFVAERGDHYLQDVAADDLPHLYRAASLMAAGIPLAAGTDAPFGGCDPWAAVRAATCRRTRRGAVIGPAERLAPADALGLFLGRADRPAAPRHVRPGAAADLCLLDVPLAAALAGPSADLVAMTVVAGEIVYRKT